MQATTEQQVATPLFLQMEESASNNNFRSDTPSTAATEPTFPNIYSHPQFTNGLSNGENGHSVQTPTSNSLDEQFAAWKCDSVRTRNAYKRAADKRRQEMFILAREEAFKQEIAKSCVPKLQFSVRCNTSFGQNVYVVGSTDLVGEWNVDNAVPLSWTEGNVWVGVLPIPAGKSTVEYKYIIKNGASVQWESGPNRKSTVSKVISMDWPEGKICLSETFRH